MPSTILNVPISKDTGQDIVIIQEVRITSNDEPDEKASVNKVRLSFPARCRSHGSIPTQYKTGSEYPHDLLIYGQTTIICCECGDVQIVRRE